jgi:hypothetical protein
MTVQLSGLLSSTYVGNPGATGITGASGVNGSTGATGYTGATGAPGSTGAKGDTGNFGGAAFDYHYSTTTTNADPGSGYFRLNTTDLSAATNLYISDIDYLAENIYNFLVTIDDSTSAIKGHFSITNRNDATKSAMFAITGIHGHSASYFDVPISYLSGETSFSNDTDVIITFARSGDKGDTGAQGASGATGFTGATGIQGPTGGASGPTGPVGATGVLLPWFRIVSLTTLVAGRQYIADTVTTAFTVNLPATPSTGDTIIISDGGTTASNWTHKNLTVARNGSTILGQADDLILDVGQILVYFVYDGSTWKVTSTSGARGASGVDGINGASGIQGPTGGASGPQGATGVQGTTGPGGSTGPQGIQGASGSTGLTGATGSTGPTGITGASGATGTQGASGVGATGVQGITGASGPAGSTGPTVSFGATSVISLGYMAAYTAQIRGSTDGATGATGSFFVAGAMAVGGQTIGATGAGYFSNSIGVGTAPSGTTGEIRATNNVTAYYTSDITFKENIRDIPNALDKVNTIGGKLFDWSDKYIEEHGGLDAYFMRKEDFGVVAQDVQQVFPVAVRTKEDGTLAVDYEKLCALAFAAIKELSDKINNKQD